MSWWQCGSHTYVNEGTFPISISVVDVGGSTTTITGSASVADAALTGSSAAAVSGTEGASASLTAATFTDANPGDHHGDFTATINWGDSGPTSSGTVTYSNGTYTVSSSHSYADDGTYPISIAVNDVGGSTTTITGSATIGDAALTGSNGASLSGTEGALASLTAATFTDANPGDHDGDFTATINWGDNGPTSSGTVSYSGGQYTVSGSHTYANEGTYPISISVVDVGGSITTVTGSAKIGDAVLAGSSGAALSGSEGSAASLTSATFTDANPGDHHGDFTATINWGDNGPTSTGTVSYSGGTYTVSGSHTYAEEGSYPISIAVTDVGGSTTTITGSASVADAALTGSSAAALRGMEGASASLTAATFTDANPGDHHGDFTATINWGDNGPISSGTVTYSNGTYTVSGSHTYADDGTYPISITVNDVGGSTTTITGSATIGDAALTGSNGASLGGTEGAVASLTNATFTDANPGDHHTDFTATINWGDNGPTSSGTVSYSSGQYTVSGSHTYANEGTYPISISVVDTGGSTATVAGSANIGDAALAGSSGAALSGSEGVAASLTSATFTDANPGDHHGDFTATINWGDNGPTSTGTVSYSGGTYTVSGSHTYAEEGSYPISIAVTDVGGDTTTINGTATVGDAHLTGSSAATLAGTEGSAASLTAATFSDAAGSYGSAADFTATITWGDGGPTSTGTVVSDGNGHYHVTGSYSYAEEGSYPISIAISDDGGSSTTITGTANVADAPLTATGRNIDLAAKSSFTGAVATFTDAKPGNNSAEMSSTIVWGDKTTTTGTIAYSASSGTYTVTGTHSYSTSGTYTVTVNIADTGGSKASVTGTARIIVTQFSVNAPTAATAGSAFNVIVTALDKNGNTAANYAGTVHFTSTDTNSQTVLPADYTFQPGDNGSHTFTVILTRAGKQTVTVNDVGNSNVKGTTGTISVSAAAASTFTVAGFPSSTTAGVAGSFTVTAKDPYNNTATGYTGTVHFASSDGQAVLPANSTLSNGTGTFTATLKIAGSQSITATDTSNNSITGSQTGITVNPAAASGLVVTGYPSPVKAGTSNNFTVTAKDPYGNTATGYTGTVTFSSSDNNATLPGSYKFTAKDAGTHTFSATFNTIATQSLTATDKKNGFSGTQAGIVVQSALVVSLPAGGRPFSVTATLPAPLTRAMLAPVVREAIDHWKAAGLDAAGVAKLRHEAVRIAALSGSDVGLTVPNAVLIDRDAHGFGWFVDASPASNPEFRAVVLGQDFRAAPGTVPGGHIDLLTVVEHEFGHVLGLDHSRNAHDLMAENLRPGERKLPTDEDVRLLDEHAGYPGQVLATVTGHSIESMHWTIGTALGNHSAGQSVLPRQDSVSAAVQGTTAPNVAAISAVMQLHSRHTESVRSANRDARDGAVLNVAALNALYGRFWSAE
jgi:large repetitive protein